MEYECVIVIGLHRSGSSCISGCLSRLGVFFGHDFIGCESEGGHEERRLAVALEHAMRFPGTLRSRGHVWVSERTRPLIGYLRRKSYSGIFGVKYPHLCFYAPAIERLCPQGVRIVNCERPLEESIASLILRSGKRHGADKLARLQRKLWQWKQEYLAERGHYTIDYGELLQEPESTLRGVSEYLGLRYCSEAAHFVQPNLRRINNLSAGAVRG